MRRSAWRSGRSLAAAALIGSMLLNGGAAGAAAATVTAPTASEPPATASQGRFGPFGYRGIRLGMSEERARATGKIVLVSSGGPCSTWRFRTPPRAELAISRRLGVVAYIDAPRRARTPEGIGVGSTRRQLTRAYPQVRRSPSGVFSAAIPRNPRGDYIFVLSGDRVRQMVMALEGQDCAN
ncbi:hypothetical protein ACFOWE_33735 [Planomonospora corallina]|uniref:Lipoprotein n=1 Tax=Planomonospora corallina TaxID=1806052 RepID=A0ABV8IN83_9ACTN